MDNIYIYIIFCTAGEVLFGFYLIPPVKLFVLIARFWPHRCLTHTRKSDDRCCNLRKVLICISLTTNITDKISDIWTE